MTKKYLSANSIMDRYSIGRSTIWDWVNKGKLPPPIKIHGATRWILSELEEHDKKNMSAHVITNNLSK